MHDDILQAKILVVDDEPSNLRLLKRLLAIEGYNNVITVSDPREVCPRHAEENFDLILLDINMPHMDGFAVMEELKAMQPNHTYLPVLVLTAQIDRETRLRALNNGARDFLTKPFDRQEALNRIHNILEVHSLHKTIRNQNEGLESRIRERTQELYDTRLEIVQRLGRAAEYRDNETGNHIIRMSKYSQLLALAAGMNEYEAEQILHASPMHDIGKIGIPDNILLKPGKLDAEEWKIMQSHTTIGDRILSGSSTELLELAREIAMTHHERWDGSGYPNSLKGEEIPLYGRIVALCDVFDALTSERPYKKAWTVEDAMMEVHRSSGTHFDPHLVELFEDILQDILAVMAKYRDKKNEQQEVMRYGM
ncbi:MAG: two-component system response regulator [Gammaproteobacteria bacterium]|nr:MAG: two-component system response regulator [Gammaproteobacteria bacterium]